MKMRSFFIIVLISVNTVYSQNAASEEYITIIPGERYEAGWFYEFLFGEHWRDVWTTPIKVKVLNLNSFAGGLVPIKKGGGQQTKSLRFKGNDGQIWKFRSVDKDPSKILPPDLKETVAEDIVQDQISSANPLAPLIVIPMLKAVDILEAVPELVFLPDDEKLGEFREEFGGTLGFIEVHPNEGEDDEPGFANAIDVKGTYKLFDHLSEKRNEKIDKVEFLKARLMDILFGDWDRHMDQWRWAKYKMEDGKVKMEDGEEVNKIWEPIPRDRDQAFSKYDGLFPFVAAYIVPQLNSFDYDYPQIEDLAWNGRFLDRRVLTELDKETWDSITAFVQSKITDEVIEYSVKTLPDEVYKICAEEITSKLKSRRDKLKWASGQFYNIINKYADIFCSDKDDYVEVNRIDDNSTEVSVYKREYKKGDKDGEPLFYKIYDNNITIDLRIHLNDGDDKAYVYGECDESPVIRIIGGEGKDEFIDESIVHGYFLTITPFPAVQRRTYFYDSGDKTKISEGPGTVYDDYKYPEPQNDLEKYEPPQIDRGHNWLPVPIIGLSSNYGLKIGGGVQLYKYNFREIPYEYHQQLTLSYETRFKNFAAEYSGDFYSAIRNVRLNLLVQGTEQIITRYFGYGNETAYNKNLEKNDFYRVDQRVLNFSPSLYYKFNTSITGWIGFSLVQTKTDLINDTLLTGFRYDKYGTGKLNALGIHTGAEFNERNNEEYPTSGFYIKIKGEFYPEVFNLDETFFRTQLDLRCYLTPEPFSFATLALRAGGGKNFGKYPFYAGNTIGGEDNLRSYNDNRFYGDASVFGQAELRMFISRINIILKSNFGIKLFAETGRVFIKDNPSDKWHPSYGFGFWSSYFNDAVIVSSYAAFSPERTSLGAGLGIGF